MTLYLNFTCYFTSTRVFSHTAHNTDSDFPSYSSNVFYNPSPHPMFTNNHSLHFVSFPFIQNSHPVFIYFCHLWHWYLGKFRDNFLIESTTMIRYRLSILTDTSHSGDMWRPVTLWLIIPAIAWVRWSARALHYKDTFSPR